MVPSGGVQAPGKLNGAWEGHGADVRVPPADERRTLDERERWIARHAAILKAVLEDPQARAEVLALLGGDDHETRRQRRLAQLETELGVEGERGWKTSS